MRAVLAFLAGVCLVASVASVSLAAAPPNANRFVGQFDIVDWDLTSVIGHVDANFSEPTSSRLVPGTIDITWAEGSRFRETHAQLVDADFGEMTWEDPFSPTGTFHAIYALATGYRCDYTGMREATCEPFAMMFQHITEYGGPTADKVGFSVPGSSVCCDGDWWPTAKGGAWALSFVNSTNP
jgi:hypothetical protein